MAKTRQEKEQVVAALTEKFQTAPSVVFANFQGLSVPDMEELRATCREQGIEVLATKKTLLKRALDNAGLGVDTKTFEGGVAAFVAAEDEVAPAQTVAAFAKDHEVVTLFGGILEQSYMDAAKVEALSKLPSKHELLGKVVGSLNAPISGFVNVLSGNTRGLVNVLNAIKDQKQEA